MVMLTHEMPVTTSCFTTLLQGQVNRTFDPGLKDPGFNPSHNRSLDLHMCSPVQIDWFINGQVVCGLLVTRAPKKIPLSKRGNLPGPGRSLKQSLGLNDTQSK
jgi:hypothetical protein